MPLPVAPLLGWLLGVWLAWTARGERPERGGGAEDGLLLLWSRPVRVAFALGAFVFGPIVGYFVAFHGDWSYFYVVPWRVVPSAVDLLLVVVAGATVPAGVAAGAGPARAGRVGLLLRLAAGPAAVALLMLLLGARRLMVSASYAQFHGAFGVEPLASSALGRGLLLAAIALAAAVAWTARALRG